MHIRCAYAFHASDEERFASDEPTLLKVSARSNFDGRRRNVVDEEEMRSDFAGRWRHFVDEEEIHSDFAGR